MEIDLKKVEQIFETAAACAPGPERSSYLSGACGGDETLRGEVESLLAAHEKCGRFLEGVPAMKQESTPGLAEPLAKTVPVSGAAALAAVYLDQREPRLALEDYLAEVPQELRREVRERIEAALAFRAPTARPAVEPDGNALPKIAGFTLVRVLGRGGLGTVYEARDEKLRRTVALKVLRPQPEAQLRSRILNEARRAAAVRDPAIVTIYSVLDDAEPPAIVMELVNGFPLDQFCQQLTFQQKARILQELVRGLSVAHGQGLIHRDLKPENILAGPDMKPKILDFGLAIPFEEVQGGLGYFEGSPRYASPEQAAGKSLTAASDVFSLGSVMFKVLTGRAPFPGDTIEEVLHAIATTHPPFLRTVATGTPEDLQAICLACLSWNPADRPTAAELVVELGRFLAGEPVHLKPRLYDDILRQRISARSTEAETWQSQNMISPDERDAMEVIHRRILADEDHWIIDARRITLVQTALYAGAWLMVVAAVLIVWLFRDPKVGLGPPWRWLAPMAGTLCLLGLGWLAERRREALASASFLAAAALSIAPSSLAWLAEFRLLATKDETVKQLLEDSFTNQQVLAASVTALAISTLGLARLKMTGFAWTTAVLGTTSYVSLLLQFNWLDQKPHIMALWCLPLALMEPIALAFERLGRVRWTMPYHLVSLVALVVGLDTMASDGPTLQMLGITAERFAYFDHDRQVYLSVVLNGLLFLGLMLATEHSRSLDLRRAAKVLEVLGIAHTLSALFANAHEHHGKPYVAVDVALYLVVTITFLCLGPLRSRWRLMVGGLAGLAFGSYLLLYLVFDEEAEDARKAFVIALGAAGLLIAVGAYLWLRRAARPRSR